jgi:SAM-dependent methyltransferase
MLEWKTSVGNKDNSNRQVAETRFLVAGVVTDCSENTALTERRVGPESRKTYRQKVTSGFIAKYLSGAAILDIGYKGSDPLSEPIVPQAVGIDLDYPGYEGTRLPFEDGSQDALYSSHCLEHIPGYQIVLADWYRVLKTGGYMVLTVPHKWLYERKATVPSRFNVDHQRFYTPASLLVEIESSLPAGGYRVRQLCDNDEGFDAAVPAHEHAQGCYEIELVIEKVALPPYAPLLTLSPEATMAVQTYSPFIRGLIAAKKDGREIDPLVLERFGCALQIPPYALLRQLVPEVPDAEFRPLLRPLIDMSVVDPDWYLTRYPEVQAMINAGHKTDARLHYRADGYFQHFRPAASPGLYG